MPCRWTTAARYGCMNGTVACSEMLHHSEGGTSPYAQRIFQEIAETQHVTQNAFLARLLSGILPAPSALNHARPFVGASQGRSWNRWVVLGAILWASIAKN